MTTTSTSTAPKMHDKYEVVQSESTLRHKSSVSSISTNSVESLALRDRSIQQNRQFAILPCQSFKPCLCPRSPQTTAPPTVPAGLFPSSRSLAICLLHQSSGYSADHPFYAGTHPATLPTHHTLADCSTPLGSTIIYDGGSGVAWRPGNCGHTGSEQALQNAGLHRSNNRASTRTFAPLYRQY